MQGCNMHLMKIYSLPAGILTAIGVITNLDQTRLPTIQIIYYLLKKTFVTRLIANIKACSLYAIHATSTVCQSSYGIPTNLDPCDPLASQSSDC